jgi:hypothetical protein
MSESFDLILDRCLDRVREGESVETILIDYPEHADQLRPLLQVAVTTSRVYSVTLSTEAKLASKQRFNAALITRRESRRTALPWYRRGLVHNASWAAIAAVVVALVITFIGVPGVFAPVFSPASPVITATPSATGNFALLISDEVNAIDEFESVIVKINRIGLQMSDNGSWVEFPPEVAEVDLTTVPGDASQKIWQGDVPHGEYSRVFVYVDNISGVLKATGQPTEIKLPSHKLHLSVSFVVSDNTVTSFTYDMTVVATGNQQNVKYILKPQVGESGASQLPREPTDLPKNDGNRDNGNATEQPMTTTLPSGERPTKRPK